MPDLEGRSDGQYIPDTTPIIADGEITNSKLAPMSANSIKANPTATAATPQDYPISTNTIVGREAGNLEALTSAQVRAIINVEDGADVTDTANVSAAGATMDADTDLTGNGYFLDEDDMVSDDDTKVPSQQSVKAYVNNQIASSGYVHPNHSGDVVSVGDGAQTIQPNVVDNAKAADMPSNTVKVNNTASTDDPIDLSMPSSTILARLSTGNIKAASSSEIRTLIGVEDGPNPIIVLSSNDTTTTFNQSTPQILSWDIETEKDSSFSHSNSINNSRITVANDGTYKIEANIRASSSSQRLQLVSKILINGVVQSQPFGSAYIRNAGSSSDFWTCVVNPPPVKLNANDYIEIQTQVESQTTTSITATFIGTDSSFSAIELKGLKGDQGDTGAGSNIVVQQDDITVGTVTSTLNFEGDITVTDEGSNKTTVDIGKISKVIFSQYISGTTVDPATTATTPASAPVLAEMTHTFTPEKATNRIEVYFSGSFECTDAGDNNAMDG